MDFTLLEKGIQQDRNSQKQGSIRWPFPSTFKYVSCSKRVYIISHKHGFIHVIVEVFYCILLGSIGFSFFVNCIKVLISYHTKWSLYMSRTYTGNVWSYPGFVMSVIYYLA